MTKKNSSKNPRWSIDIRAVIDALQSYVTGKKTMTAAQVQVALTLLEKRITDAARPKPVRRRPRQPESDDTEASLKDLE